MTTPLEQFQRDSKNVTPIFNIWRRIWQWIFDESSCHSDHEVKIYADMVRWSRIVDYQIKIRTEAYGPEAIGTEETGKNGNPWDEIKYNIEKMNEFLEKNRTGGFDNLIGNFKAWGIDYRRYVLCQYWFPEVNTATVIKEGQEAGQAALAQDRSDNPQNYPDLRQKLNIKEADFENNS